MSGQELRKILNDKSKKFTLAELKQVLYELKQDAFNELCKSEIGGMQYKFYDGEQNAFQIALDLLEHFDGSTADTITLPYLLCTSRKFACVILRDCCGKVQKTYTMPIDDAMAILRKKEQELCHTND